MSETPLTDSQLVRVYGKTGEVCAATATCAHPTYVPSEFARAQERKIAALRARVAELEQERQREKAELDALGDDMVDGLIDAAMEGK